MAPDVSRTMAPGADPIHPDRVTGDDLRLFSLRPARPVPRPTGFLSKEEVLLRNLWPSVRSAVANHQDKITRSLPEARQQIQAHIDHIKSLPKDQQAAEFAKIASTESDCSSARKGGDLGWFGRGQMQKAFEVGGVLPFAYGKR